MQSLPPKLRRTGARPAAAHCRSAIAVPPIVSHRVQLPRLTIAASCSRAGTRWVASSRRSRFCQSREVCVLNTTAWWMPRAGALQALVSSPTASASRACRSSKVQNRSAFNSNAQATCSESRVRTPIVAEKRSARPMHTSHARVGKSTVCHTPAAVSASKLCHAVLAPGRLNLPVNTWR